MGEVNEMIELGEDGDATGKGEVCMIVAMGKDGAIGRRGDLIWRLPEDLKRFKALTTGHPIVMGRKTWESLPKRPLPKRRNIVVSRQNDFRTEGAETASSIEEALEQTKGESTFIIGGAEIYKASLPFITKIYLTFIDESCEDADTFLPLEKLTDDKINLGGFEFRKTEESELNREPVAHRYVTYIL